MLILYNSRYLLPKVLIYTYACIFFYLYTYLPIDIIGYYLVSISYVICDISTYRYNITVGSCKSRTAKIFVKTSNRKRNYHVYKKRFAISNAKFWHKNNVGK